MSYILEALKKSEKKRPAGTVPDLFTVQGPLPAGRFFSDFFSASRM